MILHGGTVYFFDGVRTDDLYIHAGRFVEQPFPEDTIMDLTGLRVFPGLIDMHIHGFRGHYCLDENPDSLCDFAAELARYGVTSFLPTTTAAPPALLLNALRRLKSISGNNNGAVIRGIYMEGPFLSPVYKGAMREDCLCLPDTALAEAFQEASGGLLKVMAIAPELDGADVLIRWCVKNGIRPSIAHTAADYATACAAIGAGADHVTHLFNAMADPRHREPGVFGAALDGGATAEIIADGHHVHPAFLRMAYRLFGPERLILISDDTPISGCGDGSFCMDGRVSVVRDGVCRLPDGHQRQCSAAADLRAACRAVRYTADRRCPYGLRNSGKKARDLQRNRQHHAGQIRRPVCTGRAQPRTADHGRRPYGLPCAGIGGRDFIMDFSLPFVYNGGNHSNEKGLTRYGNSCV